MPRDTNIRGNERTKVDSSLRENPGVNPFILDEA